MPHSKWLCASLACVLGASLTLSYAPFAWWWLTPISLSAFIVLLRQSDKPSAMLGFAFGLGWFGAGISWVHVSIAEYGGLPLVASIALMVLLCSYLALYPALAFWLLSRFFQTKIWPLALPLIWLLCEWLRSWMLTGFPWLSLGYSQISGPLSGFLPIVGEVGISSILIAMAALMGTSFSLRHAVNRAALCVGLVVLGWAADRVEWTSHQQQSASVTLIQGNIEQSMRWVPEQDKPTMDKYLRLSQPHWQNSDVMIWPEAAIPAIEPLAQSFLKQVDQQAAQTNTGLITGIVNYNFDTRQAYNNLIGLGLMQPTSEQTNQGHYRYLHSNRFAKHHLLPIGEFVPFEQWLRKLGPLFDLPMSSFSRGLYQQDNLQANGIYLAPAICFEIVFPQQIAANLYAHTDMLLTVSNDAWFGNSHGPAQHLEIAQVRAKEFGLPVLRATNNGITAVIDESGQIQQQLPQFVDGALVTEVNKVAGYTPYRQWGNSIAWCICAMLLLCGLWRRGLKT